MKRKFKVTIGEKTFIVKVEEIREAVPVTTREAPTQQPTEEKPAVRAVTRSPEPSLDEEGVVKAPMPGVILSIKCRVNDKVTVGEVLLTLEAMKMENEITAPKSGVIKRIAVSEKQKVDYGDILVEME